MKREVALEVDVWWILCSGVRKPKRPERPARHRRPHHVSTGFSSASATACIEETSQLLVFDDRPTHSSKQSTMFRLFALAAMIASAQAFAPAARPATRGQVMMSKKSTLFYDWKTVNKRT